MSFCFYFLLFFAIIKQRYQTWKLLVVLCHGCYFLGCGHCKNLKPEWEKASTALKEEEASEKLAAMDATKYKAYADRYKVMVIKMDKLFFTQFLLLVVEIECAYSAGSLGETAAYSIYDISRASLCCNKKLKKLHLFLMKVAKSCIYAHKHLKRQ